jgi:hypothetical protein
LTENEAAPPPGAGFAMRPLRVPGFAIAAVGRLNVMDEPATLPETPASVAVVDEMNPEPITVTVVAALPPGRDVGETLDMTGVGLA